MPGLKKSRKIGRETGSTFKVEKSSRPWALTIRSIFGGSRDLNLIAFRRICLALKQIRISKVRGCFCEKPEKHPILKEKLRSCHHFVVFFLLSLLFSKPICFQTTVKNQDS